MNEIDESATYDEVVDIIRQERRYQDQKWGTIKEHPHTIAEWLLIIEQELNEAKQAWIRHTDFDALIEIVQVVAVGVACLEQHGPVARVSYGIPKDGRNKS